jgi:hypothetical protein
VGELNDPVDYPEAMGNLVDALANYLYTRYEDNKHNIWPDDPRSHGGVGDDPEPWESAGKRMRDKWDSEAMALIEHFAKLYRDM